MFPAVAELALVEELVCAAGQELAICAIPSLRFKAIVRPGDELGVHLSTPNTEGVRNLRILRGSEIVAQGLLVLADLRADE